ncbi:cobalamin adenosyltransferase [Peptococcaceae bacterium 1198_IL3148]
MKFITEMELRDLYKIAPFTTYALEPDTRITPGARQFLVDHRVTLVQAQPIASSKKNGDQSKRGQESWSILRLRRKMESIESLFMLITAELLYSGAVDLADEIQALGKCFREIKRAEREQLTPEDIQFWGWSEQEIRARPTNLEFDISDYHLGLENGKELTILNYLRTSLREVEPAILEAYWDEDKQACLRQDLIDQLYLSINKLCIMMWKCLGGQKWKG